jgi:hypothetical protein
LLLGVLALTCAVFAGRGSERVSATTTAGYSFGTENSWIRVQNVGNDNANVEIDYFDENGKLAGKDLCPSPSCPPMYPGSGWTFFQKDNPTLPQGFQGSAVVSTDQPIVALLAKDVVRGSLYAIGGSTMTTGVGAHKLYLPLAMKRDGPGGTWNGRFVIQNMSDSVPACVTITYLSNTTDDETAWEPYKPPVTGNPQTALPGCPSGGMPLPPRGSIFRYPENMLVADKFTGAVRIDLAKNGAGQGPEKQFISATADTWNSNQASFDSYNGFDDSDMGTDIVLPLIDRQVGPSNSYSTRFQIANKSPQAPTNVSLRWEGYDLSSGTPVPVSKTSNVVLKSARMCYQDRDDNAGNCLANNDKLPSNFIGTVRMTSTQPIGVIVSRGTTINDTFTDYQGVKSQDGSRRVLLPVLNKNYGSQAGGNGWNSWFRVMVADGGTANVTVKYYGLDLPGGGISYTKVVNREFTVFQYLEDNLPSGFAGTAIIESDRPIVALANLTNDLLKGDPDILYNGVPLN